MDKSRLYTVCVFEHDHEDARYIIKSKFNLTNDDQEYRVRNWLVSEIGYGHGDIWGLMTELVTPDGKI